MPNPIKFYYTNETVGGYTMSGYSGGVVLDFLYGTNSISLRLGSEYIPLQSLIINCLGGRRVLAQLTQIDYAQVDIPAEKRKEYPPVFGRQEFDWLSYAHFQVNATCTFVEFCMPISVVINNYEGGQGARILSFSIPDLEVTFHVFIKAFLTELKRAITNRVFTIIPSFNESKYELRSDSKELGYNLYPAGEDTNEKEGGIWGEILFAYFPILFDEIEEGKPAWAYLFLFWNTRQNPKQNPLALFILLPKAKEEATPAYLQGVTNISLKKGAWRVWKGLYPTGTYTFNPYPHVPAWRETMSAGKWIFLASVGNQLFTSFSTPRVTVSNNRFPLVVYQMLWYKPPYISLPTQIFYTEIPNVYEATVGLRNGEIKCILPANTQLGVRAGHSIFIQDTNYSPALTYRALITDVRFKHTGENVGVQRENTAGKAKIVEIEFQSPYTVDFHTNPVRLRSLLGIKVRELIEILHSASPIAWDIRFLLILFYNGQRQAPQDLTEQMLDLRMPDLFPEGVVLNSLEDYLLVLGYFAYLALEDLETLYGQLYTGWYFDYKRNRVNIIVSNFSFGLTEENGEVKVVVPPQTWDFRNINSFIARWESETVLEVGEGTNVPPQTLAELRMRLLNNITDVDVRETYKLKVEYKGVIPPVPPEEVMLEQEVRIYFRDDYFVDGRIADYTVTLEHGEEVSYTLELTEVKGNIGGTWIIGELPPP